MLNLIPIHDQNPTWRTAWVTIALIAINVVVFLLEPVAFSLSGDPSSPAAAGNELQCRVTRPRYDKLPFLSVLYAMFLHGSWLHLLGNMLFLWVFGNNVEDRLGRVRYLLFYLLCGYVATYGFAVVNPGSTTTLVGASGAIAGVLGAYLLMFPRARVTSLIPFLFFLPAQLPAWIVLGSWFVLQYF